jgi:hypothetical protein
MEDSGNVPLRWLSGTEYSARRSPTLKDNPQARLNENLETSRYLGTLEPNYLKELKDINGNIGQPMSENCRLAIGIPALNEGRNLRKTLELYKDQKDKTGNPIDTNLFEIHILHENPLNETPDDSQEVVKQFKKDFPDVKVHYIYKDQQPGITPTVGKARKYLSDLALLRNSERAQHNGDFILISNDADAEQIEPHYVTDMIEAFDKNPNTDAFTANFSLPESALKKPNVLAAVRFWSLMARVVETGSVGNSAERHKEPVGLVGRNAAIRSSMYAAVGGYNPLARNAEDLEMGWLIADSRGWDPQSVAYLNGARIVSNPRRHLLAVATKTPVNEMYVDFHKHPEVRTMDNEDLLARIPDDLDLGQLQDEVDTWWLSRTKGEYKYLGERFEPIFKRAMAFLGLEYQVVNDRIQITSARRLIAGMEKRLGRTVYTTPLVTGNTEITPEDAEKFTEYGSELTQGLTHVRDLKAKEYEDRIAAVREGNELVEGDRERLAFLLKERERFTNSS